MDGLRYQAKRKFLSAQKLRPRPPEETIPLVTVRKSRSGDTSMKHEDVRPAEIIQRANQPVAGGGDAAGSASLRIAQLESDSDHAIYFDGKTFLDLYQAFDLDLCWLSLLRYSVYGFQHLEVTPASNGDRFLQFYLKTVNYTLIWSHNLAQSSTNGVMISRLVYSREHHDLIYRNFSQAIDVHRDLVDDPRFCSFIAAISLNDYIQDYLLEQNFGIREVEIGTRHGTWSDPGRNDRPTIQKLARLSKDTGFCLANLTSLAQHASVAKDLLQSFDFTGAKSNPKSASKIEEATPLLTYQIDAAQNSIATQQERGRIQQSIVSTILSSIFQL